MIPDNFVETLNACEISTIWFISNKIFRHYLVSRIDGYEKNKQINQLNYKIGYMKKSKSDSYIRNKSIRQNFPFLGVRFKILIKIFIW